MARAAEGEGVIDSLYSGYITEFADDERICFAVTVGRDDLEVMNTWYDPQLLLMVGAYSMCLEMESGGLVV